ALLAVLGIGLIMVAFWLFRLTRPDKELLAPLEVMGERKWRRADPVWQRRRLDEVRPDKAQPLVPSAAPPDLDEPFDHGPAVSGVDDLHEDAQAGGEAAPEVDTSTEEPTEGAEAGEADDDESVSTAGDGTSNGTNGRDAALVKPSSALAPTPIGIERPLPD